MLDNGLRYDAPATPDVVCVVGINEIVLGTGRTHNRGTTPHGIVACITLFQIRTYAVDLDGIKD